MVRVRPNSALMVYLIRVLSFTIITLILDPFFPESHDQCLELGMGFYLFQ